MTFFGKAVRAIAVMLAVTAGSMHAKPAKADGGAVVAGIAGGLILGTIIGSTANANSNYNYNSYQAAPKYYAPAPTYYAPVPVYRPYYNRPSVSFSFGTYSSPKRFHGKRHFRGHRGHRGYRGYRGYRGHARRHHRRHH